ncbi:MAG: nucleotidyltransferase family protein [Terriglobales bacterium]
MISNTADDLGTGVTFETSEPRPKNWRPETRVLLLSARPKLTGDQRDELRNCVCGPIDWNFLLASAHRHALVPLLSRYVNAADIPLAAPVAAQLADVSRSVLRQNLALVAELKRLLPRFEAEKIPVLPHKGPVLASWLYGSLGMRQCADLDLLVAPEDAAHAHQVLAAVGLRPASSHPAHLLRLHVRFGHESAFFTPEGLLVELQWRISSKFYQLPLPLDAMIARAGQTEAGGILVPLLQPEDLLLLLILHGGKHLWERLIWVTDIHALITACPNLDWPAVRTTARRLGAYRLLLLGLSVTQQLFGTPLPDCEANAISADRHVEHFTEFVLCGLENPQMVDQVGQHTAMLRLRERNRDRIKYVAGLLLDPRDEDWRLISLPPWSSPLYRLIRLGHAISKSASRLWR